MSAAELIAGGLPVLEEGSLVDGRYVVVGRLGSGAMGAVYRARDRYLRRDVALKLVPTDGDRDPFAEGAALASLRHPHVVAVHAAGELRGAAYLAMELVEGFDLGTMIEGHAKRGSRLAARATLRILAQVADALEAAHVAGLLHRDVKPANVVVESGTGRAVLVDFGLASLARDVRASELAVGSPPYMAPELWEGARPDERTDQYALACTAYEALTGVPPFDERDVHHLSRLHRRVSPPRLSARRHSLAALDAGLLRALGKRPDDRFASCAALGELFEEIFARGSRANESAAGAPSGGALRALVVDDDRTFLRFAARCTELALGPSATVVAASSGTDAIEAARTLRPDLLVLDFSMPDLDGVELLTELRAAGLAGHAHVIVASASAEVDDLHRFRLLGVIDFFEKPVTRAELVAKLVHVGKIRGWHRRVAG